MKFNSKYTFYEIMLIFLIISKYLSVQSVSGESCATSNDSIDIRLYLHPFPRAPEKRIELLPSDEVSLKEFNFRSKNKTIFLIHGFISNSKTHMPITVRNEYLHSGLNYNIITVDWGLRSLPEPQQITIPLILESFPVTVARIPLVTEVVVKYIEFLLGQDFCEFVQIHLIGHSLGAHVAGRVGDIIHKRLGQKLGRISGLDPSGPNFQLLPLDLVLDREDACFVDVYHANTGILGYLGRMGHVDFYPNGGRAQPGCFGESICSHNSAVEVFSVTINQVISACKCGRFKDWGWVIDCVCNDSESVIRAGEFTPTRARGVYYYTTSPSIRLCHPFEFNC